MHLSMMLFLKFGVVLLCFVINGMMAIKMEDGKTYSCSIFVNCACGGGEGRSPDLYVHVSYRELVDGKQTLRKVIAESSHGDEDHKMYWHDLFKVKYNSAVTQEIFINLFDWDGGGVFNKDDFLGETDWFPINQPGKLESDFTIYPRYGGELAQCNIEGISEDSKCSLQPARLSYNCYEAKS